jgi:hypothetical protein
LCWGRIRDLIVATGDATIGRKGSRDGQVPHLDALWRQSGVVDAVKVLQRARRRYNHYPNCPDTRQEYYDAKYQWKRVKNAARQSVWVETCQSIQRDKKDPAKMWRNFGVTVPREYVPLINVMPNGALDLPGSATEGIQATAQYFAEVCSEHKVDQPLPIHSQVVASVEAVVQRETQVRDREQISGSDTCFEEISASQVREICRRLTNPCKATGPDEVHPKLLAAGGPLLFELLAALMTYSLKYSVIPAEWKQANVTALYKGKDSDKSDVGSFRPVSVTCAVARVMERVLFDRIYSSLDNPPSQAFARDGPAMITYFVSHTRFKMLKAVEVIFLLCS